MKWRRCLIHFESKGGGLEEKDNPFPAQVNGDRIRPLVTLPFIRPSLLMSASPSHSVSREIISNQERICSGRSAFCCRCRAEECLGLQKLPIHIHTLPDQRRSGGPIRTPNQRAFSTRSRSERPVTPNWIPRGGFARTIFIWTQQRIFFPIPFRAQTQKKEEKYQSFASLHTFICQFLRFTNL